MSHKETVKFEGLTIQMKAQCDTAISSLCKIDKTLENVKRIADKVRTKKVDEYEQYLLGVKATLEREIENFKIMADSYKDSIMDEMQARNLRANLNAEIIKLEKMAIDLTGTKLAVIDQLVNEGLLETIDKIVERKMYGVKDINQNILSKINSIEDISLRDIAYQQLMNGIDDYDTIMEISKKEYNRLLLGSNYVEELEEELKDAGIPDNEVKKIVTMAKDDNKIDEMQQKAYSAIVNETVRKETLKVIIKSIRDRGFIVDTKKNIKIDREKNIVKLVAKKADGKTAEFEISLEGKFMYHFEGYEGQACKQDITPFLDDLKNIYDINILHQEVHWSNPDKIQTQKYQYVNTKKDKK